MRIYKYNFVVLDNHIKFTLLHLKNLYYLQKIVYYEYILHLPDSDFEFEHCHIYIESKRKFDNFILSEFVGCAVYDFVRVSDFGLWYWNTLQDISFCSFKKLSFVNRYFDKDFICSDCDYHTNLVLTHPLINYASFHDVAVIDNIYYFVYSGLDFNAIRKNIDIPLGYLPSYERVFKTLSSLRK